mmetsp:Transcript_22183/g.57795  ORF Transcript_22183/g.57795 Transcript_22183/m.57795 type:complete len:225 (-) Transcript_22183:247-921(-)
MASEIEPLPGCSTCASAPVSVFHRRSVPSCDADAHMPTLGWRTTANTKFLWPTSVCAHSVEWVCQSLMVKSREPVAISVESGLMAREYTVFSCAVAGCPLRGTPSSVTAEWALFTSQMRTVPSSEVDTTRSSLGRKRTAVTKCVWPFMVRMRRPVRVSARMTSLPWQPLTSSSPCFWKVALMTGEWCRCSACTQMPECTFQTRTFWSWLALTQRTLSWWLPAWL